MSESKLTSNIPKDLRMQALLISHAHCTSCGEQQIAGDHLQVYSGEPDVVIL